MVLATVTAGSLYFLSEMPRRVPDLPPASSKPAHRESWTFAFYLAGDNSMEAHQVENFKEICEGVPAVTDANIVVFLDRNDETSHDDVFTTWKGSRLFNTITDYRGTVQNPVTVDIPASVDAERFERSILHVLKEAKHRDLLMKSYEKRGSRYYLIEQDPYIRASIRKALREEAGYLLPLEGKAYANLVAVDADTLSRFMNYVKDTFVTDRYLLCITGHSNGWFVEENTPPPSPKNNPPEYFQDWEVHSLQKALTHDPVDVLLLDMCSMGDIETAWALKDCAGYLVSHQTAIPTMGLDYTRYFERLGRLKGLSPRDVAYQAVEAYKDTYAGSQFTLSAVALDLGTEFRSFVRSLQKAILESSNHSTFIEAIKEAHYVSGRTRFTHPMADLFPLAAALGSRDLSQQSYRRSFVVNHASVNTDLTGLSLYLPYSREAYIRHRDSYIQTPFAHDFPGGWASVLERTFNK